LAATTTGGYNITILNAFNAPTKLTAINSAGQVVGFYVPALTVYGFLYQGGVFSAINCPNVQSTTPMAISDSGIVFGTCGNNNTGSINVFQYVISSGQLTMAPIQVPAGYSVSPYTLITTISPTGEVFGYIPAASGFQAFRYLYPNGPATFLTGLPNPTSYEPQITGANSSGEFVGNTNAAFQYLDGAYSLIPQLSNVTGVGPAGQLLGEINGPVNSPNSGAVYQAGLITLLQLPSAVGSEPTPVAMNASGYLVGTYNEGFNGFLATPVTPPSNEKSVVHIDSPNAASATLFGSYQLSGWAINNNSGIDDVNILVDGALMGTTTTTLGRPDVCAAYPNQSGCPTVGWQYMLDTTRLADGPHTLETVAISNTGQRAKTTASITVANAGQTASPLKLTIDTPTSQSPLSGQPTISGWAEDPGSYISYVSVSFDDTVRSSGQFGIQSSAFRGVSRPDVCAAFPGDLNCPNVGWSYSFNSLNLTNGPHTMTVVAFAANGDETVVTKTFTVANAGALKLFMDQPTANSGTLSGQIAVSGWAIDLNSHVSSVTAVVDGMTTTNMNFGLARPDVCAAIPGGLDCPNVGWSGSLDTTLLANGTHSQHHGIRAKPRLFSLPAHLVPSK
jgi:hypothetical protein